MAGSKETQAETAEVLLESIKRAAADETVAARLEQLANAYALVTRPAARQ